MSNPVVPSGRLAIGDVVSGAFKTLFRRFWSYFLLGSIPFLTYLVLLPVAALPVIFWSQDAFRDAARPSDFSQIPTWIWVYIPVMIVVLLTITWLIQVKCQVAGVRIGLDEAAGKTSTFSTGWRAASGTMIKMLPVAVLWGVLQTLIVAAFVLPFLPAIAEGVQAHAANRKPDSTIMSGSLALGFALVMLMIVVGLVLSYYFAVKFAFFSHLLTEEPQLSGIGSLKRSWTITKGHFWQILGYQLLLVLLCMIPGILSQILSSLLQVPLNMANVNRDTATFEELGAVMASLGVVVAILVLLQIAISVIMTGFQYAYYAMVYVSRQRAVWYPAPQAATTYATPCGAPTTYDPHQPYGVGTPAPGQPHGPATHAGYPAHPGYPPYPTAENSQGYPAPPSQQPAVPTGQPEHGNPGPAQTDPSGQQSPQPPAAPSGPVTPPAPPQTPPAPPQSQ